MPPDRGLAGPFEPDDSAGNTGGTSARIMPPASEGDDRVGVSNGCVITGSCAVVVGDDTFVLFLTGLDEGSFCPEIL